MNGVNDIGGQMTGNHSVHTNQNKVRHLIASNAARMADKTFIESIGQNQAISFRELAQLADRVSSFLSKRGIGVNDRVALLSNNSIEHIIIYLAVIAHGAVICTINVESNITYMGDLLRALDPRLIIDDRELGINLPQLENCERVELGNWQNGKSTGFFAQLSQISEEELSPSMDSCTGGDACIYFTSGTSDRPKGVILSQSELFDNIDPVAEAFRITERDRILDFRSFNWASAQILSALAPLSRGATLILASKFSQSNYLDWIRDCKVTIAAGNPTIINMMLNRPSPLRGTDLPTLRFITSSSAPLIVDEWLRFEEMYQIRVAQGYGSSETGWIAASNESTRRIGSVGKPFAYHDLKIVGEDGDPMESGRVGRVELGGESHREYRYLSFDGSVCSHATGRILTGDFGYLDKDGFLFLTGREKELIIRGGVNISPVEIDGILLRHESIAEVATVGVPDPIWGEEVVGFVVLKQGADESPESILQYAQSHLPVHKSPKTIVLKESLQKTARGKLDRKAIAEEWSSANDCALATQSVSKNSRE